MATRKPAPTHTLLDELIRMKKLKNDAALAEKLAIEHSVVSKVRYGHIRVSNDLRIAIMRAFHMPLKKLDDLCPPDARLPGCVRPAKVDK